MGSGADAETRRIQGEDHRRKMAEASQQKTLAANDVGELPQISEAGRSLRERCRFDLHLFLVECFPKSTGLKPFSADQRQAIQNLQDAILNGGQIVQAWPRGFAKTAIATRTAMWAALYGHARYIVIYSAGQKLATSIVNSMKTEFYSRDELFAAFPEPLHCIRKLNNTAQRCKSQTFEGQPTKPEWSSERVGLPNLPDYVGSGCVIESKPLEASRGASETQQSGEVDRPDLVLFDDPQTNAQARNPEIVLKIISAIETAIMGGGHGGGITSVINCTVIEEDDVSEHYLNNEDWVAVRIKMLKSMPSNMGLWDQYAEIKRDFSRASQASEIKARKRALSFYQKNRADMDEGCDATWEWCYAFQDERQCEISATQHAMNLYYKHGSDFFEKECQNNPRAKEAAKARLKWSDVADKRIQLAPNVCPEGSEFITGHVDVHDSVLCYMLVAWSKHFGGHILRWRTWPEQSQHLFAFRKARVKLADVAPDGSDSSAAIYHALGEVFDEVFGMDYYDETGGIVDVNAFGVDVGYDGDAARDAIKNSAYRPLLYPMFGKGIGAKKIPISEWDNLQPGDKRGEEWVYKRPAKRVMRQFGPDTNHWKTFVTEGLRFPIGHRHGITVHDATTVEIKMMANQIVAERPDRVTVGTRSVDEWALPTAKPDNHAFDNLYNSAVLASYLGLYRSPERKIAIRRKRRSRKVKYG